MARSNATEGRSINYCLQWHQGNCGSVMASKLESLEPEDYANRTQTYHVVEMFGRWPPCTFGHLWEWSHLELMLRLKPFPTPSELITSPLKYCTNESCQGYSGPWCGLRGEMWMLCNKLGKQRLPGWQWPMQKVKGGSCFCKWCWEGGGSGQNAMRHWKRRHLHHEAEAAWLIHLLVGLSWLLFGGQQMTLL